MVHRSPSELPRNVTRLPLAPPENLEVSELSPVRRGAEALLKLVMPSLFEQADPYIIPGGLFEDIHKIR